VNAPLSFIYIFCGPNFRRLGTNKIKSNVTHTKDICEKNKAPNSPGFEEFLL
jgi:hypothetical protein